MAKDKNHHRADHKVNRLKMYDGYNVRLYYKSHLISLACDGEDSRVYQSDDSFEVLFSTPTTTGEAILKCFQYIDTLTS